MSLAMSGQTLDQGSRSKNFAAFSGSRSPYGEEFRECVRPFAANSLQKQQNGPG
jgi:hypothetical protein